MEAELIEELIEEDYRSLALFPKLCDDIEELVLEDFDQLREASEGDHTQMKEIRIELGAQLKN